MVLGRAPRNTPTPLIRPYLGREFPLAGLSLTPAAESADADLLRPHDNPHPFLSPLGRALGAPKARVRLTAKADRLSDTNTRDDTSRYASRDGSVRNGCSRSTSNELEPRLRRAPSRIEVRRARRL